MEASDTNEIASTLRDPVTDSDHAAGPAGAPITIVEYGDYECDSCLNAVPIIADVRKALGDRMRFVFRHFPQSSIHRYASAAAEAAEAAAEQGLFWQMHDALFKHQRELPEIDLSHLALTLGAEIYRFETSQANDKHRQRILADIRSGKWSGVTKTPTLFINGRKYTGPINAPAIIAAAEAGAQER